MIVERPSANPVMVLRVVFPSGSASDPAGREGVTALTARWMAEGGTRGLSPIELREKLFPMAATIDVQVDKEATVFTGRVHHDHLEAFVPIFVDVLTAPRWDAKEFERLQADAVNEVARALRLDNDEELGKQALSALLYEGHPYGHPIDGTVKGLSAVKKEHCRSQAARVLGRRGAIVGVAGDFPKGLPERLKAALAALPAGEVPGALPSIPAPKARVLLIEKDTDSTAISMGYPYDLRRGHADFYPMMLAVSALGEHRQFHGRLFQELRAKRGLNYGDYAYIESFVQEGWSRLTQTNIPRRRQHFEVWLRPVENKNRLFALRAALLEMDRLVRSGLSAEEVAATKNFLAGYTMLWSATDTQRLGNAIDDSIYGLSAPGHLEGLRAALPSLTPKIVNEAIRRWIDPKNLRIVIVTRNAKALREALLSGAPSPIEYPTPKPSDVLEADKAIAVFPLRFAPSDVMIVPVEGMFERAELPTPATPSTPEKR